MCTGDMHKPFGPSLHLCAPLNGALTGPKTQDLCVRRVECPKLQLHSYIQCIHILPRYIKNSLVMGVGHF